MYPFHMVSHAHADADAPGNLLEHESHLPDFSPGPVFIQCRVRTTDRGSHSYTFFYGERCQSSHGVHKVAFFGYGE